MTPYCGDLLAVDPSLRSSGVAIFRGGALTSSARVTVPKTEAVPAARALRMAQEIAAWASERGEARTLACEWPQIYPRTHMRKEQRGADPNDLIGLAGVAGALAGLLAAHAGQRDAALRVLAYRPAEWIGQIPKATRGNPWNSLRGQRIRAALTSDEADAVPPSHDVIDAVGIGLHALGRLRGGKVLTIE